MKYQNPVKQSRPVELYCSDCGQVNHDPNESCEGTLPRKEKP